MQVGRLLLLNVQEEHSFLLKNLSVFEAGRSQGNHILLKHPSVAMSHFRVCKNDDGSHTIYDQGARAGTLVNGEPIEKTNLEDGDVITVGEVELRFDLVDADTPGRLASCAPDIEEILDDHEPDDNKGARTAVEEVQNEVPAEALVADEDTTPCLVVIEGDERGQVYPLMQKGQFVIGRSTSTNIRLKDVKVSRHHCSVERVRGHFIIADNGSSNGTIVNGEQVNKTVLKQGDYIRIGFTILRFESLVLEA
jgi:pSer/pThr/pTyr-binding forkhead associated (FHA) protein